MQAVIDGELAIGHPSLGNEEIARLDQSLLAILASAVHGIETRPGLVAQRRLAVGDGEDQALIVDPAHARDVGVEECGQHFGF